MIRRCHILIAASLAAVTWTGCAEEIESSAMEETGRSGSAEVAEESTPGESDRRLRTYLYSERDAVLYSRLGSYGSGSGYPVASIEAELGERVEAGEVLAVFEDREARLAVAAARPPYRAAVAEFERLEKLHEKGAASTAELEKARYEMQRKEAELDRAKLTRQRTRLRAPFAGVVSERNVRVAQRVTPDMPLFRVTGLTPLRARLQVPERQQQTLEAGARVTVRGVNGDTATARVVTVAPTIDAASGTREVIIELVAAEGFEPGASVSVDLGAGIRDTPSTDAGEGAGPDGHQNPENTGNGSRNR